MERMTQRGSNGGYYCAKCLERCDEECVSCGTARECMDRLGRFEDTGLEPEQIVEMDRLYREKREEVAAAQQWIHADDGTPDVY